MQMPHRSESGSVGDARFAAGAGTGRDARGRVGLSPVPRIASRFDPVAESPWMPDLRGRPLAREVPSLALARRAALCEAFSRFLANVDGLPSFGGRH